MVSALDDVYLHDDYGDVYLYRDVYPVRDNDVNLNTHRGINIDHGINVDQLSKLRNKCKYSILYSHLFRGFEC
jgi:hypothetical protein